MKLSDIFNPNPYAELDACDRTMEFLRTAVFEEVQSPRLPYHCFWHGEFGRKQYVSVKSAVATQSNADVVVWLDKRKLPNDRTFLNEVEKIASVQVYDPQVEFADDELLKLISSISIHADLAAWSDTCRMMLLYKYGGVYFDLDVCFLRDMSKIIDAEFAYFWDDRAKGLVNTAICALSARGDRLARIIIRGLLAGNFHPWTASPEIPALPRPFFDIGWQGDPRYILWDDFFKKQTSAHNVLDYVNVLFAYHWHNRWNAVEEAGSPFDILDRYYTDLLTAGSSSSTSQRTTSSIYSTPAAVEA